jgi:DNA-binding Lrp family transcriptional regulator
VAIINMKIDQRMMREVKAALAEMRELRFLGVTVGAYDMVAEVWFRSTEEMLNFTTEGFGTDTRTHEGRAASDSRNAHVCMRLGETRLNHYSEATRGEFAP